MYKLKLIFQVLLFSLSGSSLFAQYFVQSQPEILASGFGYQHPQLISNSIGEALVTWTDPITKSILFSRKSSTGFSSPLALNPSGLAVQSYTWSGPDLARWEQNVYVVFRQDGYETGHVYLVKSTDDGETFGDTIRVDNLSSGFAQYPDVAVYNDTVYVTYMTHNASGMDPQYEVSRSVDGGLTFQAPVAVSKLLGNEACDCCPPEIIVNDQYVIQLYRNNDNNIRDIKGVVSNDRGATFTDILDIDTHQWLLNACPSTGPDAVFEGSNLFTVYKSAENSQGKVFINQYDLGTKNSVETKELSDGLPANSNYPQIASGGGAIGTVFEGYDQATDIFFMWSFNGMQDFGTLQRLNLTLKTGSQTKPDLAHDMKNGFHIVYADGTDLMYTHVDEVSGLSEPEQEKQHPALALSKSAQNTLTLPESQTTFKLINMQGQSVLHTAFNQHTISIENLQPGYYFLVSAENNGAIHQQIIITP